jgi:hypothetical protein
VKNPSLWHYNGSTWVEIDRKDNIFNGKYTGSINRTGWINIDRPSQQVRVSGNLGYAYRKSTVTFNGINCN